MDHGHGSWKKGSLEIDQGWHGVDAIANAEEIFVAISVAVHIRPGQKVQKGVAA